MTIYSIIGFTAAPHWDAAYIEADSAEDARAILEAILRDEKRRPDTVWGWDEAEPTVDPAKWIVSQPTRPFRFVLGGGCR